MSRLTELLRQVRKTDPQLGADLAAEIDALTKRRTFGLVFERHQPEAVELPGRRVRAGDKVRVLPPRGATKAGDQRLWRVAKTAGKGEERLAYLAELDAEEPETLEASIDDLVVVAQFRDRIYPGLIETGRVERGGDKPFHTVINGENFHALEMLTYTHRHSIDAIYIDPPYNTGAKDWKYNNDYVASDDDYRHSKWLAFMERRLKVARELLNPDDSVLIVTIDEKEYLRLGLLLEQTFPEAQTQMVSITTNPKGTSRPGTFSRVDEFIYFVMLGNATVPDERSASSIGKPVRWRYLRREDDSSIRGSRPRQFYPVFVDPTGPRIVGVGEPLPHDAPRDSVDAPVGETAVFGVRESDGQEMEWGLTGPTLMKAAQRGFARATPGNESQPYIISYLTAPNIKKVEAGDLVVTGVRGDGSKIVVNKNEASSRPKTVWQLKRHSAGDYGTKMLRSMLPRRKFPFPKSLYAVEDTIRFFVEDKPNATILDFFSGSGTTAHAVMRLNRLYAIKCGWRPRILRTGTVSHLSPSRPSSRRR